MPNQQSAQNEASAETSYREPVDVDLDSMMRGEEPAAFASLNQKQESPSHSNSTSLEHDPSRVSSKETPYREQIPGIDLSTLENRKGETLTTPPPSEGTFSSNLVQKKTTSPALRNTNVPLQESIVADELRAMNERSPISRGSAPHLEALAHEIRREKESVDPNALRKETVIGDDRFAAHIMGNSLSAAKETRKDEEAREKEAVARGHKKAKEVGERHALKSLRTFESDVAEAMKGQKTSMVQMVLAEHHTKQKQTEEATQEKKRSSTFILGSIGLIILSISIVAASVWYMFTGEHVISILEPDVPSLLFAESSREFRGDELSTIRLRGSIAQEIAQADLRPDAIEHLYVTEVVEDSNTSNPYRVVVSTERFFELVGNMVPDWMIRSLNDEFMLGIHAWNGNQVFFVFTTNDFDVAFSNTLSWEDSLPDDILPLIGKDTDEEVYTRQWEDLLIRNRDMRVVRDNKGNIVLAYTFFDSQTLILATSVDTIDEVITRIIQEYRK